MLRRAMRVCVCVNGRAEGEGRGNEGVGVWECNRQAAFWMVADFADELIAAFWDYLSGVPSKLLPGFELDVMELLDIPILFADAHNCALLREYAMEYVSSLDLFCLHDSLNSFVCSVLTSVQFLARSNDVLAIGAFTQLSQSPKLMQELWTAIGRYGVAAANRDGESMPVYKLRKLLREKKLDVDGSKAMLVARLEGNAGDE